MRRGILLLLVLAGGIKVLAQGPLAPREYAVRCAESYAHVYQVPVELVESVIDVESNWNPSAVSTKGAVGLMQLMPGTAFKFGVRNRFRIEENVRGGVAYLVVSKYWMRLNTQEVRGSVQPSSTAYHKPLRDATLSP